MLTKCLAVAMAASVAGLASGLRSEVEALIAKSGAEVAVAFKTLDGGDELLIRPDVEFHAASTMKVPVMIELFRQARAGVLKLDDRIPVVNTFHSIVDGSPFKLDVGDDSDAEVYKRTGGTMSYRDLCEAMIAVSSNLAANLIIERLGVTNIQRTTESLGAPGMRVLRGVEDDKAFQRGLNNTTTARALMTLMEKIAKGDAVDEPSSDGMIAILKRQHFNDRIPAGLPPGMPVAHKTGEITKIQHDAAIVYAERPYVLVVLIRGLQDAKHGSALAAGISRIVYRQSQSPRGRAGVSSSRLSGGRSTALQLTLRSRYDFPMTFFGPAEASAAPQLRERTDIPDRFKWNLSHIFPDWNGWQAAYDELETKIAAYAALQGTLANGPAHLLAAMKLSDDIGQLTYRVWYFASLKYDEDQRDNPVNAKRQQVQILFARASQASAWFNPELLQLPLPRVQQWMAQNGELAVYRFAVEDLYRQQEHVLDEKGEQLLSLSSRFSSAPYDAYAALSTADIRHPAITLPSGAEATLTYGQYRAILATHRSQADRAAAFAEYHKLYETTVNTYASLYHAVMQRDWFHAQARGYRTTLDAALHGNNIPPSVVENLIETTKAGTEPLRRYHRLRKRVLGLGSYHIYDTTIPLVDFDRKYPYDEVLEWLPASVAPLGHEYRERLREVLFGDWIDVYENPGKRSGAYSAPVYGVHPYMLLNYNDTLDAVFTLAHETGHSMHTLLSNAHQPFVYSAYTIFVAEVPSTLSEMLFLDHMLRRAADDRERVVLLQHAIDGIVATFYMQVIFADYELQAHRLVEAGRPVTSDTLADIYLDLLKAYHGDAMDYDALSRVTWARIPHFYSTPYYVYQYATCFASSARLMKQLTTGSGAERTAAIERYLTLLKSGGSDHPMPLLQRAGVDLSQPETVRAVVDQLDGLVTKLEETIGSLRRGEPSSR